MEALLLLAVVASIISEGKDMLFGKGTASKLQCNGAAIRANVFAYMDDMWNIIDGQCMCEIIGILSNITSEVCGLCSSSQR